VENINVGVTKEELLVIIGCVVRENMSHGTYDEYLLNLIVKLQNIAKEQISEEEMLEILKKHINLQ
jgi:hypothetical protein